MGNKTGGIRMVKMLQSGKIPNRGGGYALIYTTNLLWKTFLLR